MILLKRAGFWLFLCFFITFVELFIKGNMTGRRADIDVLKGVAALAVVFYMAVGSRFVVGVDIFLTVSGFLMGRRLSQKNDTWSFLGGRVRRLMPLTLCVCICCMIVGGCIMMPDAYENLCENVVASGFFMDNVLLVITGSDYWSAPAAFNPLLSMWYVGLIMQVSLLMALLYALASWINPETVRRKLIVTVLCGFTMLSLLMLFMADETAAEAYYLVQYRFWECGIGVLAGYLFYDRRGNACPRVRRISGGIALAFLVVILFFFPGNAGMIPVPAVVGADLPRPVSASAAWRVIAVSLTCVVLVSRPGFAGKCWRPLIVVGQMSLSIFIWNHVIPAFLNYLGVPYPAALCMFLSLLAMLSWLTYRYIEPVGLNSLRKRICLLSVWVIVVVIAFFIYLRAGVIRDVRELGVTVSNPYAVRNTEYTDRIWSYFGHFETDRTHVLLVGNSFVRDVGNIIKESDVAGDVEIVYCDVFDNVADYQLREADVLIVFGNPENVPGRARSQLSAEALIVGTGTKCLGVGMGPVFSRRGRPGYYETTVESNPVCDSLNREWKRQWKGRFIDVNDALRTPDGRLRVFTPDSMFVSFDCLHLTPAGAAYAARRLPLREILSGVSHP